MKRPRLRPLFWLPLCALPWLSSPLAAQSGPAEPDPFFLGAVGRARVSALSKRPAPRLVVYLVIDQMRPHYTYVLPNSPPAVQRELGLSAEWVAELKRVRETDGVEAAARLISDDLLRRNMVLGTSAECAEQLHQLARRWGFARFIMPIMSLDSDYAGPTIREAARIFALARQLLSEGETPHAPQRQ